MPDFSHKRGFYNEPFYLELTAEAANSHIRFTTDCSKPSQTHGELYTEPILIQNMTTVRAVAYQDSTACSRVRTHSFIFPADVLKQDDSGLPVEQNSKDHVFWTEKFDMSDVNQSDEQMIDALLDIPTMYISAPYDSIFGIAGIHRGQNLEANGGDPPDPNWHELVECSVEMIYPETYHNGQIKNWQENCGIKIQGGAGRWQNGKLDHKQSFTLEFKNKYGSGSLKNDFLVSAPFNSKSSPGKFDKVIIRTGFNRDWGSDWDRGHCAYTRDQFGRDLQILMSGWGCHGTYVHLYIDGKYWGQYNPCERMDNHALAIYFGGSSDDYFYGKGKEGARFGNSDRYKYLIHTDWTNRQLDELEDYLDVDSYIDLALVHCYSNAGDSPQYYFAGSINPPGPIYYSGWDIEDSFDGGARRSGPPVSLETYNMPWSVDKFDAYFKAKKNIDFKMRFADRVYKHCFNKGILTDDRIIAVWDSSCKVIEKSIFCEIARWGDERGQVYGYEHWKKECKGVRDDLAGRSGELVAALKKSGMYPVIDPPIFKVGSSLISTDVFHGAENIILKISFPMPGSGKIYYTTDGSDPRTWDLTAHVSDTAIEATSQLALVSTSRTMTIKARIKSSDAWSPLHQLKVIPGKSSTVVINEINYDSSPGFNPEDWVEVYNNIQSDISLAGWTLKDAYDSHIFQFNVNTVLKGGSFLVICRDTTAFKSFFENDVNVVGNVDFKFGNSGDIVRIFDDSNNLVDSVYYENKAPWPIGAAGNGATLELLNPDYDNSQVESWQSGKSYGTPGRKNDVYSTTDIKNSTDVQYSPDTFKLWQNYPNPFNPTTHIKYSVAKPGVVSLKIYNIQGQLVEKLVDKYQLPGVYYVAWSAKGRGSGIYLCQLRSKSFTATRKLTAIK